VEKTALFGETFSCTCGRTHQVAPRQVFYGDDAPARLAEGCGELAAGRRVTVLMDVRTRQAAGSQVALAFARAGWKVNQVVVPDPAPGRSPACDDLTRAALDDRLGEADLLCPAGGGVINDLGKWIARDRLLPYVCFATAASMNGYASSNIAPTIGGVKRLVYDRPPALVASGPSVLCAAPYELTASGLGDVLAKSVSTTDWYGNHLLFGEYYCRLSAGLIEDLEPLYLRHPSDLAARRPEAIEALFFALLLTGAAMTMAQTSFPASGGEHLIGHALDMMSLRDGIPHDLHGRQVGLGTILASELYRRVLATESPALPPVPEGIDRSFWGAAGDAVASEYEQKVPRLREARWKLAAPGAWDGLRRSLGAMVRPPEAIRDCLAGASAAWQAEHIGCTRDRLLTALVHAHEIRSRFTILDLARLAGVLPAAAGEIIEAWG
jgi:glycerol-1-phosphate dehydrogenase [NAD(P)+]